MNMEYVSFCNNSQIVVCISRWFLPPSCSFFPYGNYSIISLLRSTKARAVHWYAGIIHSLNDKLWFQVPHLLPLPCSIDQNPHPNCMPHKIFPILALLLVRSGKQDIEIMVFGYLVLPVLSPVSEPSLTGIFSTRQGEFILRRML